MKTLLLLALVFASHNCLLPQENYYDSKVSYYCKKDLQNFKNDVYQIPEAFSRDFFYGTTLVAQTLNATRDAYFSCQDQIVNATEVFVIMNIPQEYQYCASLSTQLVEEIVHQSFILAFNEPNWKYVVRQVANLLNGIVDVADGCEDPRFKQYLETTSLGTTLKENREQLPKIIETCSEEVGIQAPVLKEVFNSGLDSTKAMFAIPSLFKFKSLCYDPFFA